MQAKQLGKYIVADAEICHGKLTFKGTRIFVKDVLDMVAEGMSWDKIIEEWRGSITKEAISEAVLLASESLITEFSDKNVEQEEATSDENKNAVISLHNHTRLLEDFAETTYSPKTRSELAELGVAFLLAAINSGAVTLQQIYQVFKASHTQESSITEPDPNFLSLAQEYQRHYNLDPVTAIFHGYKNALGLCDDLTDEMKESIRLYREKHGLSEIEARIEMFRDYAGVVIPEYGVDSMREMEDEESERERETA
jgi:uncharacterized protein (DUF433 family)